MKTRTRIMLAGLALGAALAGGVAWATITVDSNVYTACKLKATGTIRLIDPSGPSNSLLSRCTSLETQIAWSQNGQKGDPGPAGARGSDGVDGKDGLPGANGVAGVKGETGAAGPAGAAGAKGDRGEKGEPGTPGATGPQGPPGTPGGGAASLTSLDGTPCGAPGGAQGVTKVAYATALDSDAVSITCYHPVERMTLVVVLSSRNEVWNCSGPFGPTAYCSDQATGAVAVSPADMTGKSSCALLDYDNTSSANVGATCSFLFAPGTTVTLTASWSSWSTFLGWQAPYSATPAHACVGTTTATCTITLTESRGVRAALDF